MSHGFTISSENDDFQEKSHHVFDAIDKMKSNDEIVPKKNDQDQPDEDEGVDLCCSPTKISKPNDGRAKKVPNYLTNPEKWKKYDLKDTQTLSNQDNMRAAFAFLKSKEMQKMEAEKTDDKMSEEDNMKHKFKVPTAIVHKRTFAQSNRKTQSSDKVELDHLEEDETATEFEQTIVAKLEEEIQKNKEIEKTTSDKSSSSHEDDKTKFKTRSKVCRRNIRKNLQDGFSDNLL